MLDLVTPSRPDRPDLESIVGRIRPEARRSPLAGYEHQRGWGIVAYPFESGHVLALRVSPQNDFAPFTSVWHRTPAGAWSIYVDGPRLDTACPRYWSDATEHVGFADISVEWSEPCELVVEMPEPALRWTARMAGGPLVRSVNAVTRRLPEAVLRTTPMVRLVERLADRLFDLGDLTLATPVPNGQDALVVTRRLHPIVEGSARLDGEDLGRPATGPVNPTFGEARLPARPVFTVGPGYLTVIDEDAYERAVAATRGDRPPARAPEPDPGRAVPEGIP